MRGVCTFMLLTVVVVVGAYATTELAKAVVRPFGKVR